MRAELLTRLFRAIRTEPLEKLEGLLATVIEDERKKGHTELARQLTTILAETSNRRQGSSSEQTPAQLGRSLKELPKSSRSNAPLVTSIPCQLLRHHMVLPEQVEKRFARIESEYAARGRLSKFGLAPRKKVLVYGAPGCGKTLGAERLAFNTGLPLVKVRFDSILSSYFGESASNLRAVFDAAKEQPCVLLLDECDFIARSRNEGNDVGEVPRVVNMLLQLLDDYSAPGLLVATTNLQQSLDHAIFRRFDDVFEIPKPGVCEVEKLLKMTLSAMKVSRSIDWKMFSGRIEGASAAMVVNVAQNAAKISILEGDLSISNTHLERAISEAIDIGSLEF